jgi:hypothetical protein
VQHERGMLGHRNAGQRCAQEQRTKSAKYEFTHGDLDPALSFGAFCCEAGRESKASVRPIRKLQAGMPTFISPQL